ncbi:hypothetical protein [Salininema proteolyticum]|uniref:Uncharacterized protein n=1 Tax=Salininema proteolyticum TaxID=1607685 RepID=A0ABV8TYY5_9ACTN
MDSWEVAWLVLMTAFGALELAALVRREKGDTFSEHVWEWFAVERAEEPPPWHVQARRAVLLCAAVWLTAHFATGGWV